MGTEWNTRVGFQRGTMPRVVKKVRAPVLVKRARWGGPWPRMCGGGFVVAMRYVASGFLWDGIRWAGADDLPCLDGHCDRSVGETVLSSERATLGGLIYAPMVRIASYR